MDQGANRGDESSVLQVYLVGTEAKACGNRSQNKVTQQRVAETLFKGQYMGTWVV